MEQGYPLSLALFILLVEVLSNALNNLFDNKDFKSFDMSKWSDNINHLKFVDDTMIFVSAYNIPLVFIDILQRYEKESGNKINKEKSFYYMLNKATLNIIQEVGNH